jgi:tripartite-type tricarboxylate transporter receptor subunit TctC
MLARRNQSTKKGRVQRHLTGFCCCTIYAVLGAGHALAQSYPGKPIHWIVPFVGGTADYTARLIGQKLTERWNQPVVIENRVGASGIIGTELVARAAPDGYTIILGNTTTLTVNPALYSKLPYDPINSFAPVTPFAATVAVLVVHPSLPARSVKELVALAKAKPGQINASSSGNGESPHMGLELFKAVARVNIVHIPYKSAAASGTAILAGEVQMSFSGMVQAMPHVRAGKLRALALSTRNRSKAAPELPTIAESGFPGYEHSFWAGVLAPAGTPKEIIARLNTGIVSILSTPDMQEKMLDRGLEPMSAAPEQFAAMIKADFEKYGKLIKDIGLKVD